jgi:hypothetical protein
MLDLIRQMQLIPADGLKLTFFDQIGLEQLKGLLSRYRPMSDNDPARARQLLVSWLLSVAVGVSNVHSLRRVDEQFVGDFVVPILEEDESIGAVAPTLVSGDGSSAGPKPEGVDDLLGTDEDDGDAVAATDVKRLLDIVTQKDKRVEVAGTNVVLDRDEVKESLRAAVDTGIKDKRREETDADKLEAPITSLRNAVRQLEKSLEALRAIHADEEFDGRKRKSLGVAFGKLRKKAHELEQAFEKYAVPTK